MPREGANPAVPKDGGEQGWEGQPWKETGFLSVVAQLPLGAFGRGEADLQEQQGAADRPTVKMLSLFLDCVIQGVSKGWQREKTEI